MTERADELTQHGGSRDDQVVPQAAQEKADLDFNKSGNPGFPEDTSADD